MLVIINIELGEGKAKMLEKMLIQKISEHMSRATNTDTPGAFLRSEQSIISKM